MALPILLAVVALIVNYGIVATWKVRALTVARHELWSHRQPRTGDHQPVLAYWQTSNATYTYVTGQLPEMDDARAYHPVVRGPLSGAQVKEDLFDPVRGFASGQAGLSRPLPLMGRSRAFTIDTDTHLIQDVWKFRSPQMSWYDDLWRDGLWDNVQVRIPVIYKLNQADPQYPTRYNEIVAEILAPALQAALRPMWADLDDIEFRDAGLIPVSTMPQDRPYLDYGKFNPPFPWRCNLDEAETTLDVDLVIKQIRGDPPFGPPHSQPWRMATEYLRMYGAVIKSAAYELSFQPPPADQRAAYLQSLQPRLQPLIDALTQFRTSLSEPW